MDHPEILFCKKHVSYPGRFYFIAPNKPSTAQNLAAFQNLCSRIQVPLAEEKTEGPAQCLSFAGIELDTTVMEARLPKEKVLKYHELAVEHARKKKATLKELQSLIGFLNHCCVIIPAGRAFLRRLIDLTKGVTQPHYHIRYNANVRADLTIWANFLEHFNGRSMFISNNWDGPTVLWVYTDSSHSGFGAVFNNLWLNGSWPIHWKNFHISLLEVYPILVALYTWANHFQNKQVLVCTDNMAAMHIVNLCTSKDAHIMALTRPLVLNAMRHNFVFKCVHIPGINNTQADALSRFQFQKFHELNATASPTPTPIPPEVSPANIAIP